MLLHHLNRLFLEKARELGSELEVLSALVHQVAMLPPPFGFVATVW
jgi:hypothetical protein